MQSSTQTTMLKLRTLSIKKRFDESAYSYSGMDPAENTSISAGGIGINLANTYFNNPTQLSSFSTEATSSIFLGWSYFDGLSSIYTGISQLTKDEDYRQTQNRAKGVLNILSGAQLCVGCYAAGPFLGVTMAISSLSDLLLATIDYCNAANEMELEGWLEERTKEIEFNQKRITSGKITPLKKAELEQKNKDLLSDVHSRCKVYCHTEDKEKNLARQKIIDDKCQTILTQEERTHIKITAPSQKDRSREEAIQTKLKQNIKECKDNLKEKTIKFVGASLLAASPFLMFCPPLAIAVGIAGILMIFGVSIYKAANSPASTTTFFHSPRLPEERRMENAMLSRHPVMAR